MMPQSYTDSLAVGDSNVVAPVVVSVVTQEDTVEADVVATPLPVDTPTRRKDTVRAATPKAQEAIPFDTLTGQLNVQAKGFEPDIRAANEYETLAARSLPWRYEQAGRPPGIAGEPLPYRFRTDDCVTATVLLCFFLAVWVVARSFRFLQQEIKDFFYIREYRSLFSDDVELRGKLFLVCQACFVVGLLFFAYTQEAMPDVFNRIPPYVMLLANAAVGLAYFVVKQVLYAVVNWIFFTKEQSAKWTEAYLLCLLAVGTALFPVVLLVVYFDLSLHATFIISMVVISIVKLLLFYKCHGIFFRYGWGWLHLFLYFCTLELLPMLVLWRALIYVNCYLAVNF